MIKKRITSRTGRNPAAVASHEAGLTRRTIETPAGQYSEVKLKTGWLGEWDWYRGNIPKPIRGGQPQVAPKPRHTRTVKPKQHLKYRPVHTPTKPQPRNMPFVPTAQDSLDKTHTLIEPKKKRGYFSMFFR